MTFTANFDREKTAVMVATSPRSGTHLTMDLLRRNFQKLNVKKPWLAPLDTVYVPVDTLFLDNSDVARQRALNSLARIEMPILKSHWLLPDLAKLREPWPEIADWIDQKVRCIHVIRNPEKTLASQFVYEIGFVDESRLSERDDWLLCQAKLWKHHTKSWFERSNTLQIRFEDLIAQPENVLAKAAEFLAIPLTLADPILPPRIRSHWHGRALRLRRTVHSTEIISGRDRSQLRDLFSDHAIAAAKEVVGEFAEQLGYRFGS